MLQPNLVKELTMPGVRCLTAMICAWVVTVPMNAYAQTSSLLDLMLATFNNNVALATTPGGRGVVAHTAVFSEDPRLAATRGLVTNVSQQIGSQISISPLGSSSGGFTYSYDPGVGTFSRSTDTFGPAFAERAATIGKGKFSFGMNYEHARYNMLDGKDLENGEIKFDLYHQILDPQSFVQGDVVQAALSMKLTSDTTVLFGNFGVTDRFDIGVALPIVRVSMDLTYRATILAFATQTTSPTTHLFSNGTRSQDFTASGTASGIGDVVLRGKYTIVKRGGQGIAAAIDLRLPSGDQANMLGTGATQTRIFFIGSGVVGGRVAPHLNVGYTASSHSVSDQVNYVGGVEFGATPKVTVIGDILGNTLRDTLRVQDSTQLHQFRQGNALPLETTTLQTVALATGSLSSAVGAVGVKVNPGGNFLFS